MQGRNEMMMMMTANYENTLRWRWGWKITDILPCISIPHNTYHIPCVVSFFNSANPFHNIQTNMLSIIECFHVDPIFMHPDFRWLAGVVTCVHKLRSAMWCTLRNSQSIQSHTMKNPYVYARSFFTLAPCLGLDKQITTCHLKHIFEAAQQTEALQG